MFNYSILLSKLQSLVYTDSTTAGLERSLHACRSVTATMYTAATFKRQGTRSDIAIAAGGQCLSQDMITEIIHTNALK